MRLTSRKVQTCLLILAIVVFILHSNRTRSVKAQDPVEASDPAVEAIFEALTAADRPYKKAMPISQALKILGNMKLEQHIDPDLFDIFIDEEVYARYARDSLASEQMDQFELDCLPGFNKL